MLSGNVRPKSSYSSNVAMNASMTLLTPHLPNSRQLSIQVIPHMLLYNRLLVPGSNSQ